MTSSKFWGSKPNKKLGFSFDTQFLKSLPWAKIGILVLVITLVFGGTGTALYVFVAKPFLKVIESTNVLKEDANAIGQAILQRDLVTLDKVLAKTENDLKAWQAERDANIGWAKNIKFYKINEFYSDSDQFILAGQYSIDAIREAETVVRPFASAAGLKISEEQETPSTDGLMEAFQSWVTLMPTVSGQMDTVIERVDKIGTVLEKVDVSKYPEEFRGTQIRSRIDFVKNSLSKASDYGPDIKKALTVFPRLLAVDTNPKRYMLIMQNDKEIRPTGGFMTNYATFKVNDGLLDSDFTSKDMYSIDVTLDIIDKTYDFPDPPVPYGKYLKVERWYARDMNYSPDFPSSMDQLLTFYNMAGRLNPYEIKPVDGIISMDTRVIQELLEVTGPVTVNGITYTSENVVLELEKIASLALKEQANRKRVLGYLMNAMLKNIFESTDKEMWTKLIDKGVSLALRKHLQAYIIGDSEAQALLDKYGFGGRIIESVEGDYAMAVSTNLGGDKTNWFTSKVVEHTLSKEGDRWLKTVKLTYSYTPPEGEFQLFASRFKDWVRLYTPTGTQFVGVEGTEDGSLTADERGKTWYSGYIELGPGEKKEMTFKYYLPNDMIKGNKYVLTLQKQAGIDREVHIVRTPKGTKEVDLFMDTMLSFDL
jgi:hypothetical protein